MKIRSVKINNHRKAFEVSTATKRLTFPYSRLDVQPTRDDPIVDAFVDKELGSEGFTYALQSGRDGSVHLDSVLEYNHDPDHLRDLLLYRLTLEAQKRLESVSLSKREIIRRLGTSPTQLYRLLDQTNYGKSVDQLLRLLQALDCEVELVVKTNPVRRAAGMLKGRTSLTQALMAEHRRERQSPRS
jgi:hypothetical protein